MQSSKSRKYSYNKSNEEGNANMDFHSFS
jgi:hypothetical protein